MCGIYFCYGFQKCSNIRIFEEKCKALIERRGPNVQTSFDSGLTRAFSTVLWLQGTSPFQQPVVTNDACFLWNGDVFKYNNRTLNQHQSDTEYIHQQLVECTTDEEFLGKLEKIHGPWAFVLWDRVRNVLWFGRDFFGRQSLLIFQSSEEVILTSCAPVSQTFRCKEVPANGVFKLDLNGPLDGEPVLYPWDCKHEKVEADTTLSLTCPVKISPDDTRPKAIKIDSSADTPQIFDSLLCDPVISKFVDDFTGRLMDSVRTRIENQPGYCKVCIKTRSICEHPCVGVLFSGGLDSAVIALIVGMLLKEQGHKREIDLLNVAFASENSEFNVPDRLTGLQAVQEIRRIVPEINVHMVQVNVTREELQTLRNERIRDLLNPLETVLDDSIGCAIWFAARGKGFVDGEEYESPCRVLLSGMGIDEQLGGYSRHRVRYQREGLLGLEDELRMEILRISERNLGRDNRIISDHGVMARFPFLDEDVVNFLGSVPTVLKCSLDLPRGCGEKLILRLVAHRLGLVKTSREPKRAVQFGSRIAKLENRKEKAGDIAVRA